jgi:hypothetical protein
VDDRNFLTEGLGSVEHTIHFADINGDGKADYLAVNDKTGAVNCLINSGPGASGWTWTSIGQIATGLGWAGKGVRFADIDGDGRADYLYVDGGGALTAFKNNGIGDNFQGFTPFNDAQPIATGIGGIQKDISLADIDGDGLADYL